MLVVSPFCIGALFFVGREDKRSNTYRKWLEVSGYLVGSMMVCGLAWSLFYELITNPDVTWQTLAWMTVTTLYAASYMFSLAVYVGNVTTHKENTAFRSFVHSGGIVFFFSPLLVAFLFSPDNRRRW